MLAPPSATSNVESLRVETEPTAGGVGPRRAAGVGISMMKRLYSANPFTADHPSRIDEIFSFATTAAVEPKLSLAPLSDKIAFRPCIAAAIGAKRCITEDLLIIVERSSTSSLARVRAIVSVALSRTAKRLAMDSVCPRRYEPNALKSEVCR